MGSLELLMNGVVLNYLNGKTLTLVFSTGRKINIIFKSSRSASQAWNQVDLLEANDTDAVRCVFYNVKDVFHNNIHKNEAE